MSIVWFHWPIWLASPKTRRVNIPLSGPVQLDVPARLLLEESRRIPLEPRPEDSTHAKMARPCSLFQVRVEFAQALQDVPSLRVGDLSLRIHRCRSLRELWHLRSELRELITQGLGEPTAQQRMARLQRHFPRFAPSGARPVAARKY